MTIKDDFREYIFMLAYNDLRTIVCIKRTNFMTDKFMSCIIYLRVVKTSQNVGRL